MMLCKVCIFFLHRGFFSAALQLIYRHIDKTNLWSGPLKTVLVWLHRDFPLLLKDGIKVPPWRMFLCRVEVKYVLYKQG